MLLAGERSRRYGIGELADAVNFFADGKKSGYVRITEEKDGLIDYYLIFLEGTQVASVTEGKKVKEYGKVALQTFKGEHREGVVETYLASRKAIETFHEASPQAFFVEMKKEKEHVSLKKGAFFKIAEAEIKTVSTTKQISTEKFDFSILKKEILNLCGCVRFVCEVEGALEEGCIVHGGGNILAFFEDEEMLYGQKALIRIMLMLGAKGVADIHTVEKSQIEELASLFSASRIEDLSSGESSEEFRREKLRKQATNLLGLRLGRLVLESPFSGAFSLDIFLRTLEEKTLSGYLWLEVPPRMGLLYCENGLSRASLLFDGTYTYGRKALDMIFDLSGEGSLKFYHTPISQIKEKSALFQLSKEEESEILLRKVAHEMGQEMMKEIKGAQKFKKMFAEKRGGESDGVS